MMKEPSFNSLANSEETSQKIEAVLLRFKDKNLAERQRNRYNEAINKEEVLKDIEEIADEIEEIKREVFCPIYGYEDGLTFKEGSKKDEVMEVVKEAIESQEFEQLGRGNVAKVAKSKKHPKYCYKLITNPEDYKQENNVVEEAQLLEKAIKANKSEVLIPEPYYYIGNRKTHLYVMQTMEAASLRYLLLEQNKLALEKFNPDYFFPELQKCLDSLHAAGIHHRDLHAGNVMVDFNTGKPCLIDFGKSIKLQDTDENPYLMKIERGGEIGTQTWMIDNEKIKELRKDIQEAQKKLT